MNFKQFLVCIWSIGVSYAFHLTPITHYLLTPEDQSLFMDISDVSIAPNTLTQPSYGQTTIEGDEIRYNPILAHSKCNAIADDTFVDIFTYKVNVEDEFVSVLPATVTVTVQCIRTPPVARDDSGYVTNQHSSINIPVLSNDYDPDGHTISVDAITLQPIHGTASINQDGTIKYTPDNECDADYTVTFKYRVIENTLVQLTSNQATVSVNVRCDTKSPASGPVQSPIVIFSAKVNNENKMEDVPNTPTPTTDPTDPSSAIPASHRLSKATSTASRPKFYAFPLAPITRHMVTTEDESRSIDVSDVSIAPYTLTQPSYGQTTIEGDYIRYNPILAHSKCNAIADDSFEDIFTYKVNVEDKFVSVIPAEVTVTIKCHRTPPVARDDSGYVTNQHSSINIPVLNNDYDPDGHTISVDAITSPPKQGTASINEDGTIKYTPDNDECDTDYTVIFRYRVIENTLAQLTSNQAAVSVRITCDIQSAKMKALIPSNNDDIIKESPAVWIITVSYRQLIFIVIIFVVVIAIFCIYKIYKRKTFVFYTFQEVEEEDGIDSDIKCLMENSDSNIE